MRWVLRGAIVICLWLLPCGVAHAEGEGRPELGVKVGLSDTPVAGPGISILVGLTPADPDSRALPPLHTVRLVGDIGSLDLRGIQTCRPTRSVRTSGCTTPPIGEGRGYAFQSTTAEGDLTLKLDGTVLLYSGGQRGDVSRLYAWASFPDAGPHAAGRSYVIPITSRRNGPGRSELRATLPQPEGNLFSVAQLLLSIRKSVVIDGRSIPVTSVRCPAGAGAEVRAEAHFYGPSAPVGATSSPVCEG